jgi:hypothetical protein
MLEFVTIQHLQILGNQSLLSGVSEGNVGGMAVPLPPCNHGIGTSMCGRCQFDLRHTWMYQCRVRQDAGSAHGCIHGIFRQIRPVAVTTSFVLNSHNNFTIL